MLKLPVDLQRLIEQGENEKLEFKAALPPPQHLARLLASFANAEGGSILVGIREDGTITGVQKFQVEQALSRAMDLLNPEPEVALGFEWLTPNAGVAEVEVAPDPRGPITTPDGVFTRSGHKVVPATAEQITQRLVLTAKPEQLRAEMLRLGELIEAQTRSIVDLQEQLRRGSAISRRAVDWVLGAIVSLLITGVVALLK